MIIRKKFADHDLPMDATAAGGKRILEEQSRTGPPSPRATLADKLQLQLQDRLD